MQHAEVSNPDIAARINTHIVETQWQLKLLTACLEFHGSDKNFPDKEVHGFSGEFGGLVDLFSVKRFEISLYKRIIAAAREANAPEILQSCREILEQERAMAEWIEDQEKNKTELKQAVGY